LVFVKNIFESTKDFKDSNFEIKKIKYVFVK